MDIFTQLQELKNQIEETVQNLQSYIDASFEDEPSLEDLVDRLNDTAQMIGWEL